MYSRNTVARKRDQESCENCNHYRYSIPPRYDGSRFRHREQGEVVALPDSAFSGSGGERRDLQPAAEKKGEIAENIISANALNDPAEETTDAGEKAVTTAARCSLWPAEHIKSDDLMLIVILFVLFLEAGSESFDGELLFFLALLLGMGGSR